MDLQGEGRGGGRRGERLVVLLVGLLAPSCMHSELTFGARVTLAGTHPTEQ